MDSQNLILHFCSVIILVSEARNVRIRRSVIMGWNAPLWPGTTNWRQTDRRKKREKANSHQTSASQSASECYHQAPDTTKMTSDYSDSLICLIIIRNSLSWSNITRVADRERGGERETWVWIPSSLQENIIVRICFWTYHKVATKGVNEVIEWVRVDISLFLWNSRKILHPSDWMHALFH